MRKLGSGTCYFTNLLALIPGATVSRSTLCSFKIGCCGLLPRRTQHIYSPAYISYIVYLCIVFIKKIKQRWSNETDKWKRLVMHIYWKYMHDFSLLRGSGIVCLLPRPTYGSRSTVGKLSPWQLPIGPWGQRCRDCLWHVWFKAKVSMLCWSMVTRHWWRDGRRFSMMICLSPWIRFVTSWTRHENKCLEKQR